MRYLKKLFIFLFLLSILSAPTFSVAQSEAEELGLPRVEIPETLDEAAEQSREVGGKIWERLPQEVEKIWNNEVWPVWERMLISARQFFEKNILPWLEDRWEQAREVVGQKIEEEKPRIQEELKKEAQEVTQELKEEGSELGKKAAKSVWQRFLDLFRDEEGAEK